VCNNSNQVSYLRVTEDQLREAIMAAVEQYFASEPPYTDARFAALPIVAGVLDRVLELSLHHKKG